MIINIDPEDFAAKRNVLVVYNFKYNFCHEESEGTSVRRALGWNAYFLGRKNLMNL
jgi:hypothetical protein